MNMEAAARNVLVLGAGLSGLITAKTLIHDTSPAFHSVVVFEKGSEIGGVWSASQIYDGLTTNSPALTYEIPDFPYPDSIHQCGQHVPARGVNAYLNAYVEKFGLLSNIRLQHHVTSIKWRSKDEVWVVEGNRPEGSFRQTFSHIVVCTGLYHSPSIPSVQNTGYTGSAYHSSQIGQQKIRAELKASKSIVIVGAGKSAIDLATILAQRRWANGKGETPKVYLVYRRPHWLSPRRIVRGLVPFEKLLFSRFVDAWIPYYTQNDWFHRAISQTRLGRMLSRVIFAVVGHDFKQSLGQNDLRQTIAAYPLSEALSGNLHVEPEGYLQSVRDGRITVIVGQPELMFQKKIRILGDSNKIILDADSVIFATGYRTSLPFFSSALLEDLGVVDSRLQASDTDDLANVQLFRQIVPPRTMGIDGKQASRRIAFNGYGYSLLNPTVAFISAHWISDYFCGKLSLFSKDQILVQIKLFQSWQRKSFGQLGGKGTHIGPHATAYSDELLADMSINSMVCQATWVQPLKALEWWFRPMYPRIYKDLSFNRRSRDRAASSSAGSDESVCSGTSRLWKGLAVICSIFVLVLGIIDSGITSERTKIT